MNKQAADKITKAKLSLILSNPFFGQLVMHLDFVECNDLPAPMGTDGKRVLYRADDVIAMDKPELLFVIAHEVFHCVLGHPWRGENRINEIYNYAGDFHINLILQDCEFSVSDKYLLVENQLRQPEEEVETCKDRYRKSNTDQTYKELLNKFKPPKGGCGCHLKDSSGSPTAQEDAIKWQENTIIAGNIARQQGKLPGALEQFLGGFGKPKVPWQDQLRFILQRILCQEDYTWRIPSKRYIPMGIFMPSLYSEKTPPIQGYVDSSGSCWDESILKDFGSELQGIMTQTRPDKLFIDYFDTQIHSGDVFEVGDEITLSPKGGGGTCFKDIVRHVETENRDPAVVIILTDGYGTWPDKEPDVPFIWVINNDSVTPPWGEVVRI
jgi:predicted metal-dependent peptidase